MLDRPNFIMIGDARDIPMALGMLVMTWNACELEVRQILRTLAAKGEIQSYAAAEILISELGSVSLTQALNCYSHEFPSEQNDLALAIRSAAQAIEVCRVYRNYYVHDISGVTQYGIEFSPEAFENDIPITELMRDGPFAKVYSKTAKGRAKFSMDFITVADLTDYNNYLATLFEYLYDLSICTIDYFRSPPDSATIRLPKPLPQMAVLKKPSFAHPNFKRTPALAPETPITDDEDWPA